MAGELQTSHIDFDTVAVKRGKSLDYTVRFDRHGAVKFAYRHGQSEELVRPDDIPPPVRQAAEDAYAQRFSR